MRLNRILVLTLALAAALSLPARADTYTIDSVDGASSSTSAPDAAFADAGLKGWTVQSFSSAGVDWFIFKVGPGAAVYPFHKSPDAWIGYILEGAGQLVLGDENNAQTGVVYFKKGDYLLFGANAVHSWKNGPVQTRILFLKGSSPSSN